MTTVNKEISHEFSRGNFERTYAHMSDDIQWNIIGTPVVKGKAAVIAYCNKMLTEMGNSTLTTTDCIESDESIAVQGYCHYTAENGSEGKVEFCDIYRFKQEKLWEIISYLIEIKNT